MHAVRILMIWPCAAQVPECQQEVHQVMARAASDLRFDLPLAVACSLDRQTFCGGNFYEGTRRIVMV